MCTWVVLSFSSEEDDFLNNKNILKKLKNKKIFWILAIIIIVIFIIFLLKNNYKNQKVGNNMSNKSIEEIEQYILNINSYEATIEVTINSNKSTNRYVLSQKFIAPNNSKQIVIEPSNIEGMQIEYDGNTLSINNTRLNLNKVYENYESLTENYLCLESFIEDYKDKKQSNKSKIYEENGEIIMEINSEDSQYAYKKQLYLSKATSKPTKLIINDINEKNLVYILYNEIKIDDLRANDMLAFKQIEPFARLY